MEPVALRGNSSSSAGSEPLSPAAFTALAAVLGAVSVGGVVLNALVVVVTVRHRPLRRRPLSLALLNLALCDLGSALLGGVPTAAATAAGHFRFGRLGCVLEGFSVAFFGITGLCTVAVISVERYMVVCHPMGAVLFQTRHAVAGVLASWLWSFVWNTPPLFGWGSYELEGLRTSCAPNWSGRDVGNVSYIVIYLTLCFAVPFTVILVSYCRLLWTLRQVTKLQVSAGSSASRVEVQVGCMVVVMVLAFLVTWLPYAAVAFAMLVAPDLHIDPLVASLPVFFAKSSTMYNPIIYIFMNRQFRGFAVPTLLCGWNPWASEPPGSEWETTDVCTNKRICSRGSLKEKKCRTTSSPGPAESQDS